MTFQEKLEDSQYYVTHCDTFYRDLCEYHGVRPDHKGIKRAYDAAYEIGHSYGYAEINIHFSDMLEIVIATESETLKAK